jgi:group I intron endonuclease
MASGIYKITNTINGKCYIGSAVDLDRREKDHFKASTNPPLRRAMKKYGKDKFTFEVLEECTIREMLSLEQLNIDLHRVVKGWENLYNICEVAGSRLGAKHSEESKRLMSDALKGENHPFYGKQHTDETKQLMSSQRKGKCAGEKNPMYGRAGEKHPMYGKKLSEEHKRKISESRTGDKNPRHDSTIYNFVHKDGIVFTGTQHQLRTKYGLHRSHLSEVVNKKLNSTGGWSVVR